MMEGRAMTPRLIVEVRWGPMNGRKVSVDAGTTLRVGRTDRADLVIADDKRLSNVHFTLAWDGERATLRDMDSLEGTFLDGERVKTRQVGHASWIRAGETDFTAHIEDKVPPPEGDDPEDDEMLTEDERWLAAERRAEEAKRLEAARSALGKLRQEAAKAPLFAILDAARDDRILEVLRQSVEPHQSLYEGIQGEPLATVAPYLTGPFRKDSVLLDRLVMEGWGRRWGIYVTSREPFKEVRRHFRRFLMVELEETGEPLYFRFYDPWVLKTFWPSATSQQAADLAKPLGAMFAEGEGQRLVRLQTGDRGGGGVVSPW
jgi:pSer/pThr/pTyr-binding forkhead associated (FHA) protein